MEARPLPFEILVDSPRGATWFVAMNEASLDNPVWHALAGAHAELAVGDGLARRYRRGVTPIGAVRETSSAAYEALATLVAPGEVIYLGTTQAEPLPPCWVIDAEKPMLQMVWSRHAGTPAPALPMPEVLDAAHAAEMCALVELTHPGPFGEEAYRLGEYWGIREAGRLVAMAGERFRLPGYGEISAVCTHPDWLGRGYARRLMNHVAANIQRRGETPFLHVIEENVRAAGLYQRMGFVTRRRLWARILQRGG